MSVFKLLLKCLCEITWMAGTCASKETKLFLFKYFSLQTTAELHSFIHTHTHIPGIFDNTVKTVVEAFTPVSYTHLDVYKRQ